MSFEYLSFRPQEGTVKRLAFIFHGYGRNASYVRKIAEAMQEKIPNLLVIAPEGPEVFVLPDDDDGRDPVLQVPRQLREDTDSGENDVSPEDKLRYAPEQRQWFGIKGASLEELNKSMLKIAAELNEFIDEQRDKEGLENEDIVISGFSQGGAVALFTAYMRDDPVRCVIAHSGLFFLVDGLKSDSPTLFVYGDQDEEFSNERYAAVIHGLQQHCQDLTVEKIEGLTHKTNQESRETMAQYVKDQFKIGPP